MVTNRFIPCGSLSRAPTRPLTIHRRPPHHRHRRRVRGVDGARAAASAPTRPTTNLGTECARPPAGTPSRTTASVKPTWSPAGTPMKFTQFPEIRQS